MASAGKRCRPYAAYAGGLARLNKSAAVALGRVGLWSARRPLLTLLASLAACLLCTAGFLNIDFQTASEDIWAYQHSQAMRNHKRFLETFDLPLRIEQKFLLEAKEPGGNVLTKEAFADAFDILDEILGLRAEGRTFADLCDKETSLGCFLGAVRFFEANRSIFEARADDAEAFSQALSATVFPGTRDPVERRCFLAGHVADEAGTLVSATAMRLDFSLPDIGGVRPFFKAVERLFVEEESRLVSQRWPAVRVYLRGERSVDDELALVVERDMKLVAIAVVLMVTFGALLLGKLRSCVASRRLLGSLDIVLVLFASGAGFGVSMALGIPCTVLSQALPFILLGIGLDDAFVIAGAVDQTDPSLPVELRIQKAMERVGMSITMTSLTDVCAFALGSTAKFPAVQYFCAYAALSCAFLYVVHCTAFVALLALDMRRQEAGRLDILCCVKVARCGQMPDEATHGAVREPSAASRLMATYARLLVGTWAARAAVVVAFVALAAVSIWQSTRLGTGFRLAHLCGDTGYVIDFLDHELRLFGVSSEFQAVPVMITYNNLDFSSASVQREIQASKEGLALLPSIDSSLGIWDWYPGFMRWAQGPAAPAALVDAGAWVKDEDGSRYLAPALFASALDQFLESEAGEGFARTVRFSADRSRVESAFVVARHVDLPNSDTQVEAIEEVEEYMRSLQGGLADTYSASYVYIYWDGHRIITSQLIQNVGLCLTAVVFVSAIILVHPVNVLVVFFSMALVFWDLVGSIVMWGLELNVISMINLVMAVGLVVDYNMHIVHCFSLQDPSIPRTERVILAMQELGPAVLLGVGSTFVAFLPMALAQSHLFRTFFQLLFSIVVAGGLHGLVLTPVLLSLCGQSLAGAEAGKRLPEGAATKEARGAIEEAAEVEAAAASGRDAQVQEVGEVLHATI